jgi:hypothetical protein
MRIRADAMDEERVRMESMLMSTLPVDDDMFEHTDTVSSRHHTDDDDDDVNVTRHSKGGETTSASGDARRRGGLYDSAPEDDDDDDDDDAEDSDYVPSRTFRQGDHDYDRTRRQDNSVESVELGRRRSAGDGAYSPNGDFSIASSLAAAATGTQRNPRAVKRQPAHNVAARCVQLVR